MNGDGNYQGRHYTTWVDDVKVLRRAGDEEEAEDLLLSLLDAIEAESRKERLPPPTWYYKQLAIIAAKQKDHDRAVAVLERYVSIAKKRADPDLLERLRKARVKQEAASVAVAPKKCPYCSELLTPPPTRNRKCPQCGEAIVVRKKAGVPHFMTTHEAAAMKRTETNEKLYEASLRRANELGVSDQEFARTVSEHSGRHGDAFWALSNRELLDSDSYRRKMIYRMQAEHLAGENRDWLTSARLAVAEELDVIGMAGDRLVGIGGCRCEVCAATPERVTLQAIRVGDVIPHPDCTEPPCKCWIYVPPEAREPQVIDVDVRATRKKGLLRRIFGAAH